ncbi:MAG: helix-turn-helix domain-containing protein [Desulfobacteraceae bacterium]|nr:MAG: helix-turn-helix domain-containing protein [Desulfobacteraceae bacterium]
MKKIGTSPARQWRTAVRYQEFGAAVELTIEQVAQRLNMPVETVQRWIRQGKIPMQRHRGEYTIRSEMLERWADEYKLKIHAPPPAALKAEFVFDGVAAAMRRGGIVPNLDAGTREAFLQAAVARIPNIDPQERPIVLERLIERERLASTGIGHGIALPHPRTQPEIGLLRPQITTCFLARPIDFDAIDQRPVSVLMILLGVSTKLHLSLLSRLSFYLRDRTFRDFLLSAPAAETLLSRVDQMEAEKEPGSA